MQINIDFNLLNNIIGKTNNGQSLETEAMNFEKLIASILDKQESNIEDDLNINIKDLEINEEEISEILSLLNQIINTYESLDDIQNSESNEEYVDNEINYNLDIISTKKDLNILYEISNNDFEKIRSNYNLIKNIEDINNKDLNNKDTKLHNLINKLMSQYDNKNIVDIKNNLENLKNELSKMSSSYSVSIDKPIDNVLNENYIENIKNSKLDLTIINKETNKSELDILDKIANKDDFGNFNLNILSKKNNTIDQTPPERLTYKTIELKTVQDTIKNIEYMKSNNIQELNVILKPKELGEMNIKLLKEGDGMKAILTVHSKEVLELFNKNIVEIKGHLENISVNIKDITINLQSDNTYKNQNFERSFSNNQNTREEKNKNNKRNLNIDNEKLEEGIIEDNINLLA